MFHDGSILYYDLHSPAEILPYGDSNGDGLSCLYLATGHKKQQTVFHVYALQDRCLGHQIFGSGSGIHLAPHDG